MDESRLHPLKQARETLRITQAMLGDFTELGEATIKRAERGRTLSPDSVNRICTYFSERYGRPVQPEELGLHAQWAKDGRQGRVREAEAGISMGKRQASPLEKIVYYTPSSPEILQVGGLSVNLIVLARGRYGPEEVRCFYDDTALLLPSEIVQMRASLIDDLEKRKANGEVGLPYNSETYKVKEFDTGYREMRNGREVPVLHLRFGPTDYFTQMVTDLNIGHPFREKYARAASITEHPVSEFASILGVNLNVITKDGYLIVTERSTRALVASGRLHTSVGENLLRPADAGPSAAPDPFKCAFRGAREELGLTLREGDVVFSTFTVIPDFCQYSLLSTVKVQQTRAEIEGMWRFAIPSDKWENRRLSFYPHHPDSIAQLTVSTWNRWFNVALASVILSLLDVGYTAQQVEDAFLQARSILSL